MAKPATRQCALFSHILIAPLHPFILPLLFKTYSYRPTSQQQGHLMRLLPFALFSALAVSAATPAVTQTAAQPAPLSQLVAAVDIPYTQFTLANGLRVIVHED